MEKVFKAQKLTKVFKNGGGVRGLNFEIYKGETIGIIGINGAGKTTLMRLLMGFYTPNRGSVTINGLDPFKDAAILKEKIAYIPGEIGFPQLRNGEDFLKTQQAFLEATNLDKAHEIAGKFNLFTKAKLKTMSKGMKQKTAIVSAFIRDKDILIFDEPSTGLDPLMRDTFIELIQEQKKLGKTIIFSTHIFLEAERCCDYIYFIDDGKIWNRAVVSQVMHNSVKTFKLGFKKEHDFYQYVKKNDHNKFHILKHGQHNLHVIVSFDVQYTNEFIHNVAKYELTFMTEKKYSLERYFLDKMSQRRLLNKI